MELAKQQIHVVGIGGTLRERSTSRWALEHALRAADQAGATTELLALSELRLPMYEPGKPLEAYEPSVARLIEAVRRADGLLWSTAAYNGTLAGVTKNALDFFQFLAEDERPYLTERIVGLIATAGGDIAAVNSIAALVHAAHSLRGTVAPLQVPIANAAQVFDRQGRVVDQKIAARLDQLGRLVAESAGRQQLFELEMGL